MIASGVIVFTLVRGGAAGPEGAGPEGRMEPPGPDSAVELLRTAVDISIYNSDFFKKIKLYIFKGVNYLRRL
jgi:hypothetical protein